MNVKEYVFPIKLADLLFNTYAPSHLGERLFNKIRFTQEFTFAPCFSAGITAFLWRRRAHKVSLQLNYLKGKGLQALPLLFISLSKVS